MTEETLAKVIELLGDSDYSLQVVSSEKLPLENNNVFKQDIACILNSLKLQNEIDPVSYDHIISKESFELFNSVHSKSNFYFLVELVMTNFTKLFMVANDIEYSFEKEKLCTAILNNTYLNFFEKYLEKTEGSPFSTDKAENIVLLTIDYLKTGKNVYFNNKNFLPTSINSTLEAINIFSDWYFLNSL